MIAPTVAPVDWHAAIGPRSLSSPFVKLVGKTGHDFADELREPSGGHPNERTFDVIPRLEGVMSLLVGRNRKSEPLLWLETRRARRAWRPPKLTVLDDDVAPVAGHALRRPGDSNTPVLLPATFGLVAAIVDRFLESVFVPFS